jgi:SAM-dependent methyltransferase
VERNSLPWLAKKYNLPSVDALRAMVRTKRRILDGGCGIGYTLQFFAETNPSAEVAGYDFSPEAVKFAREGAAAFPNVNVFQSSHLTCSNDLPNDYFDLVQSEGTIMCSGDPGLAVKNLGALLAPGGTLMVHVYRKMGPAREATDDALMKTCRELGSYEKMWEFSRFFTEVAEKLFKARNHYGGQLEVEVPELISTALDCRPGPQSMQEFLYTAIFQCMWDWTGGHTTVEENTQEQYDWFAPALATRHTADEVRSWFEDAGLTVTWLGDGVANAKGVTCLATK